MDDRVTELRLLASRYREAQEERSAALDVLRDAVRLAVADGLPKNEVIRASGLARQTVYDALR